MKRILLKFPKTKVQYFLYLHDSCLSENAMYIKAMQKVLIVYAMELDFICTFE